MDKFISRAPSAEETRLRAEVASLRAALGQQPAAEGAEPVGCPIPGMCAAVAAHACAAREAAEEMRERAADCAMRCPIDEDQHVVSAHARVMQGLAIAAAIRALPLPEVPDATCKSRWQPIETAPRDGTPALVYAPGADPTKWAAYHSPLICQAAYHPDAGWCVCEAREVTHWMPLPLPLPGEGV